METRRALRERPMRTDEDRLSIFARDKLHDSVQFPSTSVLIRLARRANPTSSLL